MRLIVKMNKLIYIAPIYISQAEMDGAMIKVHNHVKVFQTHFDCTLVSYGDGGIRKYHNGTIEIIPHKKNRRFALYEYVEQLLENNTYEYAYIRYPKSEYGFLNLLKLLKINSTKILIEIPTYPYSGMFKDNIFNFLKYCIDVLFRANLKKYVDRIITYSSDNIIFGIKTIKTLNGIIFDEVPIRKLPLKQYHTITLISVSFIHRCHGIDRMVEGIHLYYSNGGAYNIKFYIVGKGEEFTNINNLINKYNLSTHIILCGYKSGKQLDDLYNQADIAVNSLGIHRIGLKSESTLKSKDYVARGFPIISSYPIDALDSYGNSKFTLLVDPDDTPININLIIKFYNNLYNPGSSYLPGIIRDRAREICDLRVTLNPIIRYFESN